MRYKVNRRADRCTRARTHGQPENIVLPDVILVKYTETETK